MTKFTLTPVAVSDQKWSSLQAINANFVELESKAASLAIPLVMAESATPSEPASGYAALYFKSDGKLYAFPEGGAETEIGGTGYTLDTTVPDPGADNHIASSQAIRELVEGLLAAEQKRNYLWNPSFEHFIGTAACAGWTKSHSDTTVVQAAGVRDSYGGSNAIQITSAGSGKEGVKQTLKGLEASTTYRATLFQAKAASGDTLKMITTGGSDNASVTTTSTTWTKISDTFTTDATPTDIVLQIGSDTSGDIVSADQAMVTEGDEIPTVFAMERNWGMEKIPFQKGDGSSVAATGTAYQPEQARDNYEIVGYVCSADVSATLTWDLWKKSSYPVANTDSIATTKPGIAGGYSAEGVPNFTTLEIAKGDWIEAELESNNNAKCAVFWLLVRRR